MLIDTHSHLYDEAFDEDRLLAIKRAKEAGVVRLLLPAIDAESDERMFAMVREHNDYAVAMMGLHPTSVNDNPDWQRELERVERYLAEPPLGIGRFCAVGEIGLDLYWSSDFAEQQRCAFERQIELALSYDLPIVVHTRNAWEEMCESVEKYVGRGLRGVFHAFSGEEQHYHRLMACGDFLFGIGGTVTYKKSKVAELVERVIPLERIVLETDCPYLTPVPHRGERNESAYVAIVCDKVAALKGVSAAEVASVTTASAERMFGLK